MVLFLVFGIVVLALLLMPALVAALRARDARLGLGESSEMVA